MTLHLRDGIQQFCGECHEAACYAFCLTDVAKEYLVTHGVTKEIDVLASLYAGCDKGYIHYNQSNLDDNDNFTVVYPALYLEMLTGKKWEVRKESNVLYKCSQNEYSINKYEREKTNTIVGHFDRDNFHPIINSLTVQYGRLASLRICKCTN